MNNTETIDWLLEGDVAIQYLTHKYLLGEERPDLQERIATEGWGKGFLSKRLPNGHWGRSFYANKWVSTHYTLLDFKHLGIAQTVPEICETTHRLFREEKGADGGLNPSRKNSINSDHCINGMALNYGCYFQTPEEALHSVIDFMLSQRLADGGFNCNLNYRDANPTHSSLHTTLSALEGFWEYEKQGYTYRLDEIHDAVETSREFILQHRLYKSDKTGEIINPKFCMLSFPSRWFYDILRALVYFADANVPYDSRMDDAMDVLRSKQRKDGYWPVQAKHAGQVHFDMESGRAPSRWNTLRALRVMNWVG